MMGGALSERGGAAAESGLSLQRELDEQHDSHTSQQIKKQESVHLLSQPSLPALRKENRSQKDLRTQAPEAQASESRNHK